MLPRKLLLLILCWALAPGASGRLRGGAVRGVAPVAGADAGAARGEDALGEDAAALGAPALAREGTDVKRIGDSFLGAPEKQLDAAALEGVAQKESLEDYSRQLLAFGPRAHEAQDLIEASRVLVYGADGVGVEVCKNLALAGVGSLAIADGARATWEDLGSHFYASPRGPRSAETASAVADLNERCDVAATAADARALAARVERGDFDCVVCCGCRGRSFAALDRSQTARGARSISDRS